MHGYHIDYGVINAKVNQLEMILADNFSEKVSPLSLCVKFASRERGIECGSFGVALFMSKEGDSGWQICEKGRSELEPGLGFIRFNKFPKIVQIRFTIYLEENRPEISELIDEIIIKWTLLGFDVKIFDWDVLNGEAMGKGSGTRGMSDWRKHRADLFKKVKDGNLTLSATNVAEKATSEALYEISKELSEIKHYDNKEKLNQEVLDIFREKYSNGKNAFSDDDVRNDYEVMDWDWVDSRKIN